MSNWDRHEEGTPCDGNAHDVAQVCEKLNIPYHHVSFEEKYWCDVFEPTVSAYRSGYTLNPDVLCNQYIKFGAFHQYVMETLKVDLVATGHDAQVDGNGILHRAVCNHNDQSYFPAKTELQRFYICHKDISNNALWISPDYDDTMVYKTTIHLRYAIIA
eukprot:PhF_6_TR36203/c0_g2_i4/m.52809/K00566/mnmA, trmU; tRNA-uridine 2-sulfurtransferase